MKNMPMDKRRVEQYRSKIRYILGPVHAIPKDVGTRDEQSIEEVLYRVQTSIDAAMDMAAMLVHDSGVCVGDHYENIDRLVAKHEINQGFAQKLMVLNVTRHATVQEYGVLGNIEEIKGMVFAFINRSRLNWMHPDIGIESDIPVLQD